VSDRHADLDVAAERANAQSLYATVQATNFPASAAFLLDFNTAAPEERTRLPGSSGPGSTS